MHLSCSLSVYDVMIKSYIFTFKPLVVFLLDAWLYDFCFSGPILHMHCLKVTSLLLVVDFGCIHELYNTTLSKGGNECAACSGVHKHVRLSLPITSAHSSRTDAQLVR